MSRQLRIKYPGAVYHLMARADQREARKVVIAQAVHSLTSVSQGWIAEHLGMKSAANACQQLRRLKRVENKPEKELNQWLSRIVS